MRYGAPLDWAAVRWLIVERTGWTLETVDALDIRDLTAGLAVWRGLAIAREG